MKDTNITDQRFHTLMAAAVAVLDQVEREGRDTGIGDAFSDLRDAIPEGIRPLQSNEPQRFALVAPTGARIVGTDERTPGTALATQWESDDEGTVIPVWDGETQMFWDGQYTKQLEGSTIVVDDEGHLWLDRECIRVEG